MSDSKKKTRAHVFIRGKVQGVFFRQNTKQAATRRGVTGWVRNLADGSVEAIFEGYNEDVNELIEWCHVGPAKAKVEDIDVRFEKYTGELANFTINDN